MSDLKQHLKDLDFIDMQLRLVKNAILGIHHSGDLSPNLHDDTFALYLTLINLQENICSRANELREELKEMEKPRKPFKHKEVSEDKHDNVTKIH